MDGTLSPKLLISAIVGLLLAIVVGMPVASARNEAAGPLLSSCPRAIWTYLMGNSGVETMIPAMECWVGGMLIVVIPGTIGVGMMAFRGR